MRQADTVYKQQTDFGMILNHAVNDKLIFVCYNLVKATKRKEQLLEPLLGQLKHKRVYDAALIGKNLRKLRERRQLSVEYVREYLGLGSVQAIYKYETGRNYPQADRLLALLELYQADYMDLICEELEYCSALGEGTWMLFIVPENRTELVLELVVR